MPRKCVDCNVQPPIEDGNRCRECLAGLMRRTRPEFLRVPVWVARARENRLPAKELVA